MHNLFARKAWLRELEYSGGLYLPRRRAMRPKNLIAGVVAGGYAAASHPLRANAIAFWDLDSDSADDSGNSHTGTDTAMSYDGTKATFNGSTSKVALTGITTGTTFTLSMWINVAVFPADGHYEALFTDDAGTVGAWIHGTSGSKYPYLYSGSGGDGTTGFSISTLYHVVFSVNAGTVSFYVNGSAAGTVGSIGTMTLTSIGKEPTGTDDPFNGTMQSVGLFSDAKDSTWVTAIYNSGTPLKWAGM